MKHSKHESIIKIEKETERIKTGKVDVDVDAGVGVGVCVGVV